MSALKAKILVLALFLSMGNVFCISASPVKDASNRLEGKIDSDSIATSTSGNLRGDEPEVKRSDRAASQPAERSSQQISKPEQSTQQAGLADRMSQYSEDSPSVTGSESNVSVLSNVSRFILDLFMIVGGAKKLERASSFFEFLDACNCMSLASMQFSGNIH